MIAVTPLTTVPLGHRALHVAMAKTGHVVALSKEGAGSLIAPDVATVRRFEVDCHVVGVAISAEANRFALLEDNAMSLIALPELAEEVRTEEAIEACLFSPSGLRLWTARHADNDTVILEIRDAKSGDVTARAEVPDPFESSSLMLFSHPAEDRVALWVAAGQDGQCLYWGHYDGSKLAVQGFPGLTDTAPPGFDRLGRRFLVVSSGAMRLYGFPDGPELGGIAWPLEDDPPAETVAFVDDERAVVHSGNGRLFDIALGEMKIIEEIAILGHEPRPIRELYPNLQSDFDLCSDLSTFMPMPSDSGGFLSVHRELPSQSMADWRDQLITWRIPAHKSRPAS